MPANNQQQFELKRSEIRIIEMALREQSTQLSKVMLKQQISPEQGEKVCTKQINSRVREIQSVLGNLHNQKDWYRPQDTVPLG